MQAVCVVIELHSGFFRIESVLFMCSPYHPFLSPRKALRNEDTEVSQTESFYLWNPKDLLHHDVTWSLCGVSHCCLLPSEILTSTALRRNLLLVLLFLLYLFCWLHMPSSTFNYLWTLPALSLASSVLSSPAFPWIILPVPVVQLPSASRSLSNMYL